MRVALDGTPLLGQPTGVGAFVAGAVPALAERGDLELTAYALSLRGGRVLPERLPRGVGARTRPMPAGLLLTIWSRLDHPTARWWTGAVDVVHGTNFAVPPAPRRAAEVMTVHDLTPLRYPELAYRRTRRFPDLVRRALRRGAWVHTPASFVAAEVVDAFGADPARVRAVHHGVPVATPPSPSPDLGTDRPGWGSAPYVLALGTIEPRKDLVTLVRAFDMVADQVDDVRLVVAGPDGWGTVTVEREIVAARHSRRIDRLGYVDATDRPRLVGGAAAYAYPSRYEGFGLPPLEAMAAGVPVVASRAGALPEVLGEDAVAVEPGDVDGLAGALARVLQDGALRAELSERGRRRAGRFSWTRCAAGLAELYRDAAG